MNKHTLLGLSGLAYSGKDTAAKFFCNALELRKYTIAEPITRACAALHGMTHERWLALDKEQPFGITDKSRRVIEQGMGDALLALNPSTLLNALLNNMMASAETDYLFSGALITDVRTEEEAEEIRKAGGTVIHISRDSAPLTTPHRTERGVKKQPGDLAIDNSGSIASLKSQIETIAATIRSESKAAA